MKKHAVTKLAHISTSHREGEGSLARVLVAYTNMGRHNNVVMAEIISQHEQNVGFKAEGGGDWRRRWRWWRRRRWSWRRPWRRSWRGWCSITDAIVTLVHSVFPCSQVTRFAMDLPMVAFSVSDAGRTAIARVRCLHFAQVALAVHVARSEC